MPRTNRRRFLVVAAAAAAGAVGRPMGSSVTASDDKIVSRRAFALGAETSFVVRHPNQQRAECAIDAALSELESVEQIMSLYRPDSQLCRLNRDGALDDPHPWLVEVLELGRRVSQHAAGAFDVTVQPIWEAKVAATLDQNHSTDDLHRDERGRCHARQLQRALATVDWRRIVVTSRQIRFQQPHMRVTLNGIAQGFAADKALAALLKHDVKHALINTGEFTSLGESAHEEPWRVGLQHPRAAEEHVAITALDGRALATSGDYATRFSPDGSQHHIVDPRSGQSPTELSSVSVVAPTGVLADAYSTAFFVLGVERAFPVLASLPDVDAFFVRKDGETFWTEHFPVRQTGRIS